MKTTPETEKIFNMVKSTNYDLLIKAYAGCGKTTTIIEASKLIDENKKTIFLAFNRHIAKELKEKLPPTIKSMTTYGLGYHALLKKYGEKPIDEFKIDKIIQAKSKAWKAEDEINNDDKFFKYLKNIKKLVNIARVTLTSNITGLKFLSTKHNINFKEDKDFKRVLKILDIATNDRESFDQTDMVYLPAIDNSIWMLQYDVVFVDECQDLNKCQIRIIEKILKKDKIKKITTGRLIAVGDPYQSIYGFNGSDEKSFEWFEKRPKLVILPLSTSFRCSKNVIKKAQEIVKDINAKPDAIDGEFKNGNVIEEANDGNFILCRKTAPLIKLFFQLLLAGKRSYINGSDIGLNLIEMIGKSTSISDLINYWNNELTDYENYLKSSGVLDVNKNTEYQSFKDKVEALFFIANLSINIGDMENKIKQLFPEKPTNGIILSTIHKSKGLESEKVIIVRPDLIPLPNAGGWEFQQEKNLEYVAYTRAKNVLVIDTEWS